MCVNPYCLEDREDADCPDCGGKKFPEMTWRHADGSIRVDHMDAREGDYYG